MKKIFSGILLSILILTLISTPLKTQALETLPLKTVQSTQSNQSSHCDLMMAQRKLWIDHVSWTRSVIISDLASLEDTPLALERLLKNQDDIGNSIKPYYGEDAGNKLASLLREHIVLATKVAAAAKTGDKKELQAQDKLWHDNAVSIAKFLSSANPNYSYESLKNMLYKHLEFVTSQVVARLNKNWQADIDAYDKGEDHMIMFADVLSNGLIKQFPQKFN